MFNMQTAMEIFTHPDDLQIFIGKEEGTGKYMFMLSRPSKNYRPLLRTKPFADTVEEVVAEIQSQLESMHLAISLQLQDTTCPLTQIMSAITDESRTLTQELIIHMLDELRQKKIVDTSVKKAA